MERSQRGCRQFRVPIRHSASSGARQSWLSMGIASRYLACAAERVPSRSPAINSASLTAVRSTPSIQSSDPVSRPTCSQVPTVATSKLPCDELGSREQRRLPSGMDHLRRRFSARRQADSIRKVTRSGSTGRALHRRIFPRKSNPGGRPCQRSKRITTGKLRPTLAGSLSERPSPPAKWGCRSRSATRRWRSSIVSKRRPSRRLRMTRNSRGGKARADLPLPKPYRRPSARQ